MACSGSANAWPAPISGTPEPAVTSCVVRGPDRDPSTALSPPQADSITIAGDEVTLCWNRRPERSCWSIDVVKKSFVPQAVTDAPPRDAPRFVQRSHAKATPRADGTISLCAPAGSPCKSFANPSPTQQEWAGVSDDLSTVAIPDGDKLRIYDVATARLRATINRWPDSPMPGGFTYSPIFATPDRMIVWNSWTPVSEQGRVFDMSGKQLAIIGGENRFSVLEPNVNTWFVQGTEWVTSGDVNTLVTVDVRDPKITSTYSIHDLLAQPRPPKDDDTHILDVLAVAGTAKRLIIVTGENPFTIGIVDRATKKLDKIELPICPRRDAPIR